MLFPSGTINIPSLSNSPNEKVKFGTAESIDKNAEITCMCVRDRKTARFI